MIFYFETFYGVQKLNSSLSKKEVGVFPSRLWETQSSNYRLWIRICLWIVNHLLPSPHTNYTASNLPSLWHHLCCPGPWTWCHNEWWFPWLQKQDEMIQRLWFMCVTVFSLFLKQADFYFSVCAQGFLLKGKARPSQPLSPSCSLIPPKVHRPGCPPAYPPLKISPCASPVRLEEGPLVASASHEAFEKRATEEAGCERVGNSWGRSEVRKRGWRRGINIILVPVTCRVFYTCCLI